MNDKILYPNDQTLDGGAVAGSMEDSMKRTSHQATAILDNQDKQEGAIIRKKDSRKLYLLFSYFNRRVEMTTGLDDTPENRKKVRVWLDRVIERRNAGKLVFAEAFPGAREEKKAYFAKLEGWQYTPQPQDILFGGYVEQWLREVWSLLPAGTKKDDYRQVIHYWLLPFFREHTFFQINGVEIQRFISVLKCKKGKNKGKPLSKSRVKNILIPLRTLWTDACDQYRWFLHNPFTSVKKHLPQTPAVRREGFRFDAWRSFLAHIDPWYQPVAELMILTGMISSELAGLTKDDIFPEYIHVRKSIVRGREQNTLKTRFRNRKIPITRAIRQRLDILMARTDGDRLITTKSGTIFRSANFNKDIWKKAQEASGMTDKVPYALRHSFAAWALSIGIDMNRLVKLMGHASKQMVYEVYGDYIEGLEEDREAILEYFGADFLAPKRAARARPHAGERSCERK